MAHKVLIIDDETPVRDLFSDLLKREGCLPIGCSNREEALEKLSQENFDIVLLDIKLQEISGLEVLKDIRDIYKDLPVVMITGFGYNEDLIAKAKQFGCSGYIGKNMSIPQIISSFKQFVKNAKEKAGS